MPSERGPQGVRGERGRTGATGETGETGEVSRWVVRALVAAAIFIPLALVAVVIGQKLIYKRAESTAQATAEQAKLIAMENRATLNTIIETEVRECERDFVRLQQFKVRAQVLRNMASRQILLFDTLEGLVAAAPVAQTNPAVAQAAIDRFNEAEVAAEQDRSRIQILPLPDCGEVGEDLREHFSATKPRRRPRSVPASTGGDAATSPVTSGGGSTASPLPTSTSTTTETTSPPPEPEPEPPHPQPTPHPSPGPGPAPPAPPGPEPGLDDLIDDACGMADVDCSDLPDLPALP